MHVELIFNMMNVHKTNTKERNKKKKKEESLTQGKL